MISQNDLSFILKAHYGAIPEGADLAAKLILDHTSAAAEVPLEMLISKAQAAYPLFFAKPSEAPAVPAPTPEPVPVVVAPAAVEPPPAPVEPARPMSISERIAAAARNGEQVPDADIRAAIQKARGA